MRLHGGMCKDMHIQGVKPQTENQFNLKRLLIAVSSTELIGYFLSWWSKSSYNAKRQRRSLAKQRMLFRNFNYRNSLAHEFSEVQSALYHRKADQLCLLLTDVHSDSRSLSCWPLDRGVEMLLQFGSLRAHCQDREWEGQEAGRGASKRPISPLKGLDRMLSPKHCLNYLKG